MSKPTLLGGGKPIPFHDLTGDDFARFVHGALVELGPHIGLRVEGLPGAGGDDGFDVEARTLDTNEVVCIQCKRTPRLTLATVGLELAKVAMSSALSGARVAEQYFVCSGAVQKDVDRAARALDRTELVKAAVDQATSHDDLRVRRNRLTASGRDYRAIVEDYVASLRNVVPWSGEAFDAKLGVVMSRMESLIDRHFSVAVALREHPRPDFDESTYLTSLQQASDSVPLYTVYSGAPQNLKFTSPAEKPPISRRPATELMLAVRPGELLVLLGSGGAGKTTAVQVAAAFVARSREADAGTHIPVILQLKNYRGSLDALIHAELGIRHGHWKSLPGTFALFLDGLNELPTHSAQAAMHDLDVASRDRRVAAVLTIRSDGLSGPVRTDQRCVCWQLEPLGMREIRRVAAQRISQNRVAPFIIAVQEQFRTTAGTSLFRLPFAVDGAAAGFERTGLLPRTLYQIVDDILLQRYERNEEIEAAHNGMRLPRSTLHALAGEIAFQLYVIEHRQAAPISEIEALVQRARRTLASEGVFGADALTDATSLDALFRYEVLAKSKAGTINFAHEIVMAFLCAGRLAQSWRDHVILVPNLARYDAWLFAAHLIAPQERVEFLGQLAAQDAYVAAEVAVGSGLEAEAEPVLLALEGHALGNEVDTWVWLCALAKLNTPVLRSHLQLLSTFQAMHGDAIRARAIMGDIEILSALLPEADKLFGLATGGELSVWETAPSSVALDLARARIDNAPAGERFGASAQTLAQFGDQADIVRLRTLIETRDPLAQNDLDTIRFAAQALFALDESAAIGVLDRAVTRCDLSGGVVLSRLLASMGGTVDVDALIGVLLGENSSDAYVQAPPHERDALARVAGDAIEMVQLSNAQLRRLRDGLSRLDRNEEVVWDVAATQAAEIFDDLAMSIGDALADGDDYHVGLVCRFVLKREWGEEPRERFTAGVRKYVERGNANFTWDLARALEYLWVREQRALVGAVLREHVAEWLTAYASLNDASPIALHVGSPRGGALTFSSADKTGLELLLNPFRAIIVDAATELTVGQRLALLPVDRLGASPEIYSPVFAGIPSEQLDDVLTAITDVKTRAVALTKLAALGATPTRIRVLFDCLEALVHHPAYWTYLKRAAQLLWTPAIADAFVEFLKCMKWDDPYSPTTENNLMTAGFPIDREQVVQSIEPALTPGLHFRSRNVLLLWARKGRRRARG